jgi:TPR repeat protein
MYENGRGVGKDEARAVELYKRACDADETRGCANSPANVQLDRLARQAQGLSADQASRLEESLSHDPNDLVARARLLGYYFAAGPRLSPETVHEARLRHILWLVQNRPESELAGMSEATIDPAGGPLADRAAYEKVKALWLAEVKAHNDAVLVLVNAAWFFKLPDKAIAADLLTRAHALEPGNRNWSASLGMVYAGAIVGLTGMNQNRFPIGAEPEEARGQFAQKAREELNKSEDAEVVGTAGYYLNFWGGILNAQGKTSSDYADLAEKCLAKAQSLDPGNLEWAEDLAKLRRSTRHPSNRLIP